MAAGCSFACATGAWVIPLEGMAIAPMATRILPGGVSCRRPTADQVRPAGGPRLGRELGHLDLCVRRRWLSRSRWWQTLSTTVDEKPRLVHRGGAFQRLMERPVTVSYRQMQG
jgi:hypothetical protein